MIDMSNFIASVADQLTADDLMDNPRTITITKVTASPDAKEQPVNIAFEGDGGKPFRPCKTVRRIMVGVWGKHAKNYIGRSMVLYRDPEVTYGGIQVGGIRVSHMSHIDKEKTVSLQVTRGRKRPYTVYPLAVETRVDAAQKWANGFLVKLGECETLDAIYNLEAERSRKLAELKNARPALHAKVTVAIGAKISALEHPLQNDTTQHQTA